MSSISVSRIFLKNYLWGSVAERLKNWGGNEAFWGFIWFLLYFHSIYTSWTWSCLQCLLKTALWLEKNLPRQSLAFVQKCENLVLSQLVLYQNFIKSLKKLCHVSKDGTVDQWTARHWTCMKSKTFKVVGHCIWGIVCVIQFSKNPLQLHNAMLIKNFDYCIPSFQKVMKRNSFVLYWILCLCVTMTRSFSSRRW